MANQTIQWDYHEKLAQLRRGGSTIAGIARNLRITHTAVSSVLRGKSRSRRVEKVLIKRLGVPGEVLWPDWYRKT